MLQTGSTHQTPRRGIKEGLILRALTLDGPFQVMLRKTWALAQCCDVHACLIELMYQIRIQRHMSQGAWYGRLLQESRSRLCMSRLFGNYLSNHVTKLPFLACAVSDVGHTASKKTNNCPRHRNVAVAGQTLAPSACSALSCQISQIHAITALSSPSSKPRSYSSFLP